MITKFKYINEQFDDIELGRQKLRECQELFKELFDDKLHMSNVGISGDNRNKYNLIAKLYRQITPESYNDFNLLFTFLNNNSKNYIYDKGNITIYFDDIDFFIYQLNVIKDTNKYNL